MQDTTLFELPATVEAIRWGEFATSLSFDETQLIRWISNLHNSGQPFDLDPTYSTGHFWLGLPPPALRFDILPQCAGVTQADARHLPLAAASQRSIMFDPPFVVAPHTKPGIIRDRFSCYPDIPTLWQFYREALAEFWRLLTPGRDPGLQVPGSRQRGHQLHDARRRDRDGPGAGLLCQGPAGLGSHQRTVVAQHGQPTTRS